MSINLHSINQSDHQTKNETRKLEITFLLFQKAIIPSIHQLIYPSFSGQVQTKYLVLSANMNKYNNKGTSILKLIFLHPFLLFPQVILLLITTARIQPTSSLSIPNPRRILRPNKIKPPIPISEELGTSPSLNYQFFDPLNIANEDNFARLREAELKHGRVAMLAVLGNTLPELFPDEIIPPCNFYLSPSQELPFCEVLPPTGITTLTTVPILGWVQIVVLIWFLETRVLIQRDARDLPGDYGTGYFGLRDKSKHWR